MNDQYKLRLSAARAARTAHVLAWQQSALTQAAYCALHGINPTTFSGWRLSSLVQRNSRTLSAVPINIEPPTVAPVLPPTSQQQNSHRNHAQAPRLCSVGGWTLELAHHTCPRWLAQLLREIEASPSLANAQTDAQIRP